MRALVILVAVSYCSAQLVLPHAAPWVLPYANLITNPDAETEVKPVALASPYLHHPLTTPYLQHPLGLTPYLHHPLGLTPYVHHPLGLTPYSLPIGHHLPYVVAAADETLKATEFPYIYEKVTAEAAAEEPAVEEARRRRRDVVSVALPYIHAIPTTKEVTVETKQFEDTDAATPADTTLIKLTTKEHQISIPAVKYVQPHVNLKPVTYTAISPAFLPHAAFVPHAAVVSSPAVVPYHAAYPAFHPFHYTALAPAPVVKIDEE